MITDAQVETALRVYHDPQYAKPRDAMRAALAAAQAGAGAPIHKQEWTQTIEAEVQYYERSDPWRPYTGVEIVARLRALRPPAETAEPTGNKITGTPVFTGCYTPGQSSIQPLPLSASEPAGLSEEDVARIIYDAGANSGLAYNAARKLMALLRRS